MKYEVGKTYLTKIKTNAQLDEMVNKGILYIDYEGDYLSKEENSINFWAGNGKFFEKMGARKNNICKVKCIRKLNDNLWEFEPTETDCLYYHIESWVIDESNFIKKEILDKNLGKRND